MLIVVRCNRSNGGGQDARAPTLYGLIEQAEKILAVKHQTIIYSIGHGRHAWQEFLALLKKYEIEFLCDVRNFARSRWVQFNGKVLEENLRENKIGYEHLPETGGKIRAKTEDLTHGIERIIELSSEVRTVMMCSESQPLTKHKIPRANCHRVGLLAPLLKAKDVERIVHILPDGNSIEFDESNVPSIW